MVDEIKIDNVLDIKGEVCPYTFVKTKLTLETMESGEVLEIITDHQPASVNIPRSLKGEGHEVLTVDEMEESRWRIIVQKG